MHVIFALTVPLLLTAGPNQPTVFQEIDSRHQAGLMDANERHILRVKALKDPETLPPDLRALPLRREGTPTASFTRVFVDAYQHLARSADWGGPLHTLLQPPADLTYVLDSTEWPIRVSYRNAFNENLAKRTLAAAEISWSVQINDYGFYAPPSHDSSDLYRIFVNDTGMGGGGYTAPYDYNAAVPWTDCFTYIVIDPSNDDWSIDGVVAHEVNHSMQAAMDCLEVVTFWENTATYIMSQVFPDSFYYTLYSMEAFQSQPWRALDYMQQHSSDGYEYGGGLFAMYLAQSYTPGGYPLVPKSVLLRQIWEGSMQVAYVNNPHYYDGIEKALGGLGHSLTMEEVLVDFSEARYFVGEDDDGQHMHGAGELRYAELTLTAQHDSASLPLRDLSPPNIRRPAPYGSNHILFSFPSTLGNPLVVHFDGEDATRWAVRLVRFGRGTTVSEELPLALNTWDGSATVETDGFTRLLMVVVNLGDADYDPNRRSWPLGTYTYSISSAVPPATIDGISPAAVTRGQQNLTARLTGSGFVLGSELSVRFEDPDIQVVSVDGLNANAVVFTFTVPLSTALGPKTLVLTNGGGAVTRAEDLLLVLDMPNDDPAKTGCGCASGAGEDMGGALLLFLLCLGLWRRGRLTHRRGR